jgi:hypothetical protein
MATGTDGGLLDGPKPQSVYKHGILEQYVRRYATMTTTWLKPRRAVLFDGFGGRGRFDSREPASAEYMMRAAEAMKDSTQIDIFLVEKSQEDFARLDAVADEYRSRGIAIETWCPRRSGQRPRGHAAGSPLVRRRPRATRRPSRRCSARIATADPRRHCPRTCR